MSGTKYKEWILETIDQLRKRKARPDLERITHMVQRKHGLTFRETEALLEKLVDSEVVIKVDYKGSTSYRNAAKWRKSHLSGHVLNSNQASSRIKVAVRAITQTTAAAAAESSSNNNNSSSSSSSTAAAAAREAAPPEKRGASLREIEKWLSAQKGPLLKSQLLIAMQREVESGRLKKLESGEYVAVDAEAEKPSEAKSPPPKVVSPAAPPGPTKRGRPASKRKRFKKTPGPEFETEDLIKIEQDPKKCDACLQTAERNKYGEPEELLACKDCSTKVHPSCMDYSAELAERARNSPWQCIECKTCYVCDDSGDGGSMLFCDACDKGYHMKCHSPPVYEKPKGKWVCGTCVCEGNDDNESMEFETSASDISQHPSPSPTAGDAIEGAGPSCLPTPCDSPVQPDPDNKENLECQEVTKEEGTCSLPKLVAFDGTYPDAADWTIEDVVSFFKSAGFIEQAEAFSEQEIDGKSLLLMKRSDVLTGLSVKLGPALKMYTHVRNLQLVGQNISSAHW